MSNIVKNLLFRVTISTLHILMLIRILQLLISFLNNSLKKQPRVTESTMLPNKYPSAGLGNI